MKGPCVLAEVWETNETKRLNLAPWLVPLMNQTFMEEPWNEPLVKV